MNLEGLREAVAKGRSLARQTSLNPEPTVTIPLREAEALVKVAEAVRSALLAEVDNDNDGWLRGLDDMERTLTELEAME